MANTIVTFEAPSGLSSVTGELFPDESDTIANTGGDTATEETNRKGLYSMIVTESITGLHLLVIKTGGTAIGRAWVDLLDTTDTFKAKSLAYVEELAPVYHADIDVVFNDGGATPDDEYTINWFKNGVPITSGVTSPTIQVVKQNTAADLVASTAMSQVGATQTYKYTATSTERMTAGEAYIVIIEATIDGETRTWKECNGRDAIL